MWWLCLCPLCLSENNSHAFLILYYKHFEAFRSATTSHVAFRQRCYNVDEYQVSKHFSRQLFSTKFMLCSRLQGNTCFFVDCIFSAKPLMLFIEAFSSPCCPPGNFGLFGCVWLNLFQIIRRRTPFFLIFFYSFVKRMDWPKQRKMGIG